MNACYVLGCARKSRARALCLAHYRRLRRYGSVAKDVPIRKRRAA